MDRLHIGAQAAQALGSAAVRGSIGRVDHDAQIRQVAPVEARGYGPDVAAEGQIPPGAGRRAERRVQARVLGGPPTIAGRSDPWFGCAQILSGTRRTRAGQAVEQFTEVPLYLVLGLVAELAAPGREQLHAIVVPRIVRR